MKACTVFFCLSIFLLLLALNRGPHQGWTIAGLFLCVNLWLIARMTRR